MPVGDDRGDVGRRVERRRRLVEPDPRGDRARREAIVDRRGEQHRRHAALAIVEVGLQQGGRFPRVHRGVVEIELGHRASLATERAARLCGRRKENAMRGCESGF